MTVLRNLFRRLGEQSPLRRAVLVLAVTAPIFAIAVFVFSIVFHGWLIPVCLAAILYYFVLIAIAIAWSVGRDRSDRALAGETRSPLHSALLGDVLPEWLPESGDAALQRRHMLNWYETVGDDNLLVGALLARSVDVREVIARVATRGALGWNAVVQGARLYERADTRSAGRLLLGKMQPSTALVLARVLYGQSLLPDDRSDAIALLRWTADVYGLARIPEPVLILWASYLVRAGRRSDAAAVISGTTVPMVRTALMTADTLSPFFPDSLGANEEQWLAAFNAVFEQFGLEGIELAKASKGVAPFDRIVSVVEPRSDVPDEPLITVITSAFQPDESLATAIRAVLNQTWSNWELLLIDDASGPNYRALFERCAALDPRIRLIVRNENAGTYANRNFAIGEAKGEFVTIQDADDWAHPRRLELQARHLIASPKELANVSLALRVSEKLAFAQGRGYDMQVCEPSILFRREQVVASIGFFDQVRAGADAEYRARISAAQGAPVTVLDIFPPLTLQRDSEISLSGGDFSPGWMHPSRFAYRSAWRQWHADCEAAKRTPFLASAQDERLFPAPPRTLGVPRPQHRYDVVFVLDIASREATTDFLGFVRDELVSLHARGARVGLIHLWSVGTPLIREYRQAAIIQELINSGVADQLFLDDTVPVGALCVRSADAVQFLPSFVCGLHPESVVLVEPRPSIHIVNSDCEANAKTLFGRTPTWISPGAVAGLYDGGAGD